MFPLTESSAWVEIETNSRTDCCLAPPILLIVLVPTAAFSAMPKPTMMTKAPLRIDTAPNQSFLHAMSTSSFPSPLRQRQQQYTRA